ncbi:LLM class flavin-dependent oxidoreductase [Pseudomonas typographi]|uniref:LLM class flavin-dependent oxidoreductase n=1 Tax=Pseudomonas typographi TaxID=2715964 RepID=A0ABR7YWS0_9PSED|nr:LLM class flavin-dependent oxidoreductase [Pseudomonas typographi]MBD1597648.1 LLM class flavin-dependent oxidoreductase [Pseudomonas typographi]
MPIKVLWYLSFADGRYPWCADGLLAVDAGRYLELAKAIEAAGFYGAMVATWPNDPLVSAAYVASHTQRIKLLVASYARLTPPKLLAQQMLTFDTLTGGRLLLNLINGRDNIMRAYGMTAAHAERYALGIDYWRKFCFSYKQGAQSWFPNTPLVLPPTQPGGVQLWGTGDSPAGIAHTAELADVYLTMMRESQVIGPKFANARAAAAAQGRQFTDLGALASVTVRETEAEAREAFYAMFEHTGAEALAAKLNEAILRRTAGRRDFNTFQAADARRQGWLEQLRKRQLPSLRSLQLEGHLYAGITAWATLDVFGIGSSATYFVGDGLQVARQLQDYQRSLGLSALILSGWPLLEEAGHTARWLLPLLSAQPLPATDR